MPFSPRGIEQSLVLPPRWPLILYTETLYCVTEWNATSETMHALSREWGIDQNRPYSTAGKLILFDKLHKIVLHNSSQVLSLPWRKRVHIGVEFKCPNVFFFFFFFFCAWFIDFLSLWASNTDTMGYKKGEKLSSLIILYVFATNTKSRCSINGLITVYLLLRVKCDKMMHMCWDFWFVKCTRATRGTLLVSHPL